MLEEYFVVTYYEEGEVVIDYVFNTYDDCIKHAERFAEDSLESMGKEAYNNLVEVDRHSCYFNIEKRFRLKEVK